MLRVDVVVVVGGGVPGFGHSTAFIILVGSGVWRLKATKRREDAQRRREELARAAARRRMPAVVPAESLVASRPGLMVRRYAGDKVRQADCYQYWSRANSVACVCVCVCVWYDCAERSGWRPYVQGRSWPSNE